MRLNIQNPCTEDWAQMKIGLCSRHCTSCDKNIQDFTKKSKNEIITYLLENHHINSCARIKRSQLDFHHVEIEVVIERIKRSNRKDRFTLLALACLALTACNEPEIIRDGQPNTVNLNQNKSSKTSTTILVDTTSCDHSPKDEVNELEVPYDEILLGDIIMPRGTNEPRNPNDPFDIADKMPEFKGGIDSLFSFITKNINYPKWELDNLISGVVYASFVVERDGSISNIKILRGVSESKNFDDEVIRVLKKMPNWIPGENEEEIVRVKSILPVRFKL